MKWLGQLFGMQELDPCRKLTVVKSEGIRRLGGGLSQLRKIWRSWTWGTGDVSSSTENSGGQCWKSLRFTMEYYARGKRRRRQRRRGRI